MDVQRLIGEVARRHNVLVDPADPIFVAVTPNELLVAEYLENVQAAISRAEATATAASAQQVEGARRAAAQLMTESAKHVADQVRAAGSALRLQLDQLICGSLACARAAAVEASSYRRVSLWAAALAVACACVAAAIAGAVWFKG